MTITKEDMIDLLKGSNIPSSTAYEIINYLQSSVIVPDEPTPEMVDAGIKAWSDSKFAVVTIFKAMLAACPKLKD